MLAVTTRNRLRSARFCLPMLLARRRIAQQLSTQPGLLRYASGVRTPTEFFTLTVWQNRESMQQFMQTGLLPMNAPRAGPLGPRPEASAVEPRASGVFALTARFQGSIAVTRVVRGRRSVDGARLRSGVGLDWSPQALAIGLWHDEPGVQALALQQAQTEGAGWAMCWQAADYEIGHWDGLRLRQVARRRTRADAR
jgi:hypothetical protein